MDQGHVFPDILDMGCPETTLVLSTKYCQRSEIYVNSDHCHNEEKQRASGKLYIYNPVDEL